MTIDLPLFVHRSNYSHYYLFLDNEIIKNKHFNENLKKFSNYINGEEIIFEMIIPPNTKKYVQNNIISIKNSQTNSLDFFYTLHVNHNNNLLYYYFFDFFITDKTKNWEIYCSSTHGIAIAGCCNDVNLTFLEFIKPYEKQTAKMKLEEFEYPEDDYVRKRFIETLCFNYKF